MPPGATADKTPLTELAADFEPASREEWLALVDKAIKGADFEKKLVSRTADGLRIEPIYMRADTSAAVETATPGMPPFTRGHEAAVQGLGWELHQTIADTEIRCRQHRNPRRARGRHQRHRSADRGPGPIRHPCPKHGGHGRRPGRHAARLGACRVEGRPRRRNGCSALSRGLAARRRTRRSSARLSRTSIRSERSPAGGRWPGRWTSRSPRR